MPKRSLKELESGIRHDHPDVETALEELAPYEALARHLIQLRIERKLTQTQLAELCGMQQPAIARLEAGEHEPTLSTLRRVAHALGTALVIELDSERGREELAKL